jgi:Arc/MetJ-type ribon-helix-helix transcriptional regulator
MPTVTLKLPPGLAARLNGAVKRRGRSRSALVREALDAHLDRADEATTESCLDLARDLAGSLEGPADLSFNPRHLRGYGR